MRLGCAWDALGMRLGCVWDAFVRGNPAHSKRRGPPRANRAGGISPHTQRRSCCWLLAAPTSQSGRCPRAIDPQQEAHGRQFPGDQHGLRLVSGLHEDPCPKTWPMGFSPALTQLSASACVQWVCRPCRPVLGQFKPIHQSTTPDLPCRHRANRLMRPAAARSHQARGLPASSSGWATASPRAGALMSPLRSPCSSAKTRPQVPPLLTNR